MSRFGAERMFTSLSVCSAVRSAACAGTVVPSGSVTVRSDTAARMSPESVPGLVSAVFRLPRLTRERPVPFGKPMPPCTSMPSWRMRSRVTSRMIAST